MCLQKSGNPLADAVQSASDRRHRIALEQDVRVRAERLQAHRPSSTCASTFASSSKNTSTPCSRQTVAFQMAEVAVPHELYRAILQRIADIAAKPFRAGPI